MSPAVHGLKPCLRYTLPRSPYTDHSPLTTDPLAPDRVFTEQELKRYNGERGERAYVAHQGIVYDVSACPKWRTGLHEGLHFAGWDLSTEMPEAPHGREVFTRPCVKRVGVLAAPTPPS
jgi:predicted heme/steroid binding protein